MSSYTYGDILPRTEAPFVYIIGNERVNMPFGNWNCYLNFERLGRARKYDDDTKVHQNFSASYANEPSTIANGRFAVSFRVHCLNFERIATARGKVLPRFQINRHDQANRRLQ